MAGNRRATRPGGDPSPLRFIGIAVVLIGLVLVSLRLLPGSPFESQAVARWGADTRADKDAGAADRDTGSPDRSARTAPSPTPSPSPTLEPLPLRATEVQLDAEGWWSWSLLDTRTGEFSGSKNMNQTSTTASLIKAWIVADYLRRADEDGRTPSDAKLADATLIIRDSDNTRTQQFYNTLGGEASIKRLVKMCKLTDSSPADDGGWSRTNLSARDTARMGACIADGTAAGPEWTDWLLNEMKLVRGTGDFGIRKAFPAAQQKQIAIKNGWVDRTREQEIHVNCLAVGDGWTMGVMVRYPINLGYEYGMENCQEITEQLMAAATS
ncbi:hypothetical protein [Micromonospora cathayae]|uniref:Beta-lactamase enzyme family protein n=1 Tax=Micromonospora cathayae TaxID=3028804 RepID=A0ABY7ZTD6_9ACTN|nr:hypothetical protein [Micromonospora sp. HUAS 3]WDZ86314.1 hypothetical protein PVK37_07890 [Micromonospora sp. HUAS 3]